MDVSFFFFLEFPSADIIVLILSLFSKNLYLILGVIAKIFLLKVPRNVILNMVTLGIKGATLLQMISIGN